VSGGSYLGALGAFTASVTWAFASERYAEAARAAGTVRVNLLRALSAASLWWIGLGLVEGFGSLTSVSAHSALLLAASIACSYAIGDGIFFRAAARLGVSAALAIATIYPLWAALYGALVNAEPFGPLRAFGLLGCLGGVWALLALSRRNSPATGAEVEVAARRSAAAGGVALALLASLAWAGNAIFLKQGAQGLSLYQANVLRFSFGALFLLLQLPFRARERQEAAAPGLASLGRKLALPLLLDTGLGSVCFVYGIAHTDLALGATLSSLSPLVALPIAALSGSERVTAPHAFAVGLTVLGVVLLVLG
jgi:drug/metabolite transporter (DMT)-like permease